MTTAIFVTGEQGAGKTEFIGLLRLFVADKLHHYDFSRPREQARMIEPKNISLHDIVVFEHVEYVTGLDTSVGFSHTFLVYLTTLESKRKERKGFLWDNSVPYGKHMESIPRIGVVADAFIVNDANKNVLRNSAFVLSKTFLYPQTTISYSQAM